MFNTQYVKGSKSVIHPALWNKSWMTATEPEWAKLNTAWCYLGNGVPGTALGVSVTDAHPAHWNVFDWIVVLHKETQTYNANQVRKTWLQQEYKANQVTHSNQPGEMTNDVSTNISDVQLQIKPTINMQNINFDKVIQGNAQTTYFEWMTNLVKHTV